MTPQAHAKAGGDAGADIRRFHVHFPDEALADLKRRVLATRWPEQETVADHSQGVPLAMIRELPHHSEAHNRQETPLFAKSIERHALNRGAGVVNAPALALEKP